MPSLLGKGAPQKEVTHRLGGLGIVAGAGDHA